MTVSELIEELRKYPPDMLVSTANYYNDIPSQNPVKSVEIWLNDRLNTVLCLDIDIDV